MIQTRYRAARTAAAGLWLVTVAATAQDSAETPAVIPVDPFRTAEPASASTSEGTAVELDEVIVTAQKVQQSLRDVPASVTAISGEALKESKIVGPNDLNGHVPNAQLRVGPFAGEIRIRGYGTPATNVGFESSVGTVIDDVYYGRVGFVNTLMFDLDRFEVVRGPQGALFGKNTIAGVLNLTTTDADTIATGDVTLFMRDDAEIADARGGISIPFADGVYSRFGGAVSHYKGLFYNTKLDRREADLNSYAGRAKLRLTDVGGGELRLTVSAVDLKANGNLFQLSHTNAQSMALFRQYDERVEDNAYNTLLSSNLSSQLWVVTQTAQAAYRYPLGSVLGFDRLDLTAVTAYASNEVRDRTIDLDFSPAPVVVQTNVEPAPYDQISQELRLTGEAPSLFGWLGHTQFVGGLFYLQSDLLSHDLFKVEDISAAAALVEASRSAGLDPVPGASELAVQFNTLVGLVTAQTLDDAALQLLTSREQTDLLLDQDQRAYSAYFQVTTALTQRLSGLLGWRLGRETKKARLASEAPDGAVFMPAILGQSNHDSRRHRSESESSPKLGVLYDFQPKVRGYVVYAQGYKGGGYNALPFNDENLDYDREIAQSVEAGLKMRLFENTLDANIAAFHTRFDDLQVSVFNGTTFNIQNAASARSQGIEADVRWLTPLRGTQVAANVGYNDAIYRHYPDGPAPASAQEGDDRISPCSNSQTLCQDLSGQTLTSAPRWTASLIPQLSLPGWSPGWGFQIAPEALYTSPRFLDADHDVQTRLGNTLMYNLRLSVGAVSGAWSVSFYGSNLTEEGVLAQVADMPVGPGNYGAIRQTGDREFYGVLRLSF
jgi:outer membrane receptor protein involved in Fe transport